MRINAYEKFIKTIDENIGMPISSRDVDDEIELTDMLKKLDRDIFSFSLEFIKKYNYLINATGYETVYSNGLTLLTSVITYKGKESNSNCNSLTQTFIFSSYDEEPLVNISKIEEQMSSMSLFIGGCPNDDVFDDKDILFQNASIKLKGGQCENYFRTYKNLRNKAIMIEKYRQGLYTISKYNSNDILRLCKLANCDLAIVYKNDNPVYANFLNEYRVEDVGLDSNNPIDVKYIVDRINEEVNTICNAIKTNLTEFQKNKEEKKKVKRD